MKNYKKLLKPLMDSNINNFLIDAHCHLQYFNHDEISQIIQTSQKENFQFFLSNSTMKEDFDTTIEISQKFPQIIPGIGHHPWYLETLVTNDNWFEEFVSYTKSLDEKGINYFIGEIGIDGGKPKKKVSLEKQSEILQKQLEYANENNKLVTIHCVYEWEKLLKLLEKSKIENLIKNNKIILHSFQASKKIMEKFKKLNVWFSISSGCFVEKNYEMLDSIPLENMLLESDSPSMFNRNIYSNEEEYSFYFKEENWEDNEKDKFRYKNHPISIINLAKKISELRKIEYEDFITILKENYSKVIEIVTKKLN